MKPTQRNAIGHSYRPHSVSARSCWVRLPRQLACVALTAALVCVGCSGGDSTPAETSVSPVETPPIESTTTEGSPETTSSTTPVVLSAQEELDASLDLVTGTVCADWNAAAEFVGLVDNDLGADMMGVEVQTEGGAVDRFVMTGQLLDSHIGAQAFSTSTDEVATIHALLSFNHRRTNQLYAAFLQKRLEMVFEKRDTVVDDAAQSQIIWDGASMAEADEFEIEMGVFDLFPSPPLEATVGPEAAGLAWDRMDEWLAKVRLSVATPRGLVEQDGWATDLQDVRELFCVLFATEWTDVAAAIEGHEQDPMWLEEHGDLFIREIALQEVLLVVEYLEIARDYLDSPEVDWFDADGVDLSQEIDGVTSATEYVELWRYGAADTLGRFDLLLP